MKRAPRKRKLRPLLKVLIGAAALSTAACDDDVTFGNPKTPPDQGVDATVGDLVPPPDLGGTD